MLRSTVFLLIFFIILLVYVILCNLNVLFRLQTQNLVKFETVSEKIATNTAESGDLKNICEKHMS